MPNKSIKEASGCAGGAVWPVNDGPYFFVGLHLAGSQWCSDNIILISIKHLIIHVLPEAEDVGHTWGCRQQRRSFLW